MQLTDFQGATGDPSGSFGLRFASVVAQEGNEPSPSDPSRDEVEEPAYLGTATYSPEDNKLRFYSFERFGDDIKKRIKEAGFSWAPKQGLWVAPMWTPARYDLLVELCGEVGDEGISLEQRAAQRAHRFEGYKANRHRDAHAAADRVAQLTEHIPTGQPILIGHHSQQGAERIARKINRAMETAVDQWSRHEYWTARIPAVMDHAEWKGDAKLRHRRIKGLEADERKFSEQMKRHEQFAEAWSAPDLNSRRAWQLSGADRSGAYDIFCKEGYEWAKDELPADLIARVAEQATAHHTSSAHVIHSRRWLEHTRLRLAFEREMMERQGGDRSTRFDFAVGGRVQGGRWSKGAWQTILRVNKAAGKVNSLTCSAPAGQEWGARVRVEDVTAYEPPTDEGSAKAKKATTLAPLCNYPGPDFKHMTEKEYKDRGEWGRWIDTVSATPTQGRHRVRKWANGSSAFHAGRPSISPVYLTDKKTTLPPVMTPEPTPTPEPIPEHLRVELDTVPEQAAPVPHDAPDATFRQYPKREPTLFDGMKDALKAGGAQTVVAHQLYPTPPDIAARMVELADIEGGMCVLEPSAGTGNLVQAVRDAVDTKVLAYEINAGLCSAIRSRFQPYACQVIQGDFLAVEPQYKYPRILMNPPFENASDIKHIKHALTFLAEGGRLVGICADGPRQTAQIQPLCTSWEPLPSGTFAGTGVRTVLFTIDA
jgi:hypothetical protein